MKPANYSQFWIEVTDRSIGRVVCTARVSYPEIEQRVNALVSEHIQQRLKDPGTHAIDLQVRASRDD